MFTSVVRRRPLLVGLATAALALAAGCSSTTRLDVASVDARQRALGVASGDGATAGGTPHETGGTVAGDEAVRPAARSATASAPEAAGSRAGAGGGAPSAGGGLGPDRGPGFDESTIVIGVEGATDLTAAAESIGGKAANTGDTRAQAQAMVDHLNDTGGLAGRQVEMVFHVSDQTGHWETEAQRACADFTEDHQVFVAMTAVLSPSTSLPACLAQRGTPLIVNARMVLDDQLLGRLDPYVYLPGRISATRWGATAVDHLAALDYFPAVVRLGLVRYGSSVHQRVEDQAVLPRLASHGITPTERVVIDSPGGVSDFGSTSAQISNAILRMRRSGVTHVMILDDHGSLTFLFMPQAESQGWRPRYGLTSNNQGTTQEQNSPPGQLEGATMVGWTPADDVTLGQDPGGNPTKDLCLGIMQRAGITYPDRVAYASALGYCDAFLFLRAALERAPELSPAGIRAGVAALGDAYLSPVGFATGFGADRTDGGTAMRAMTFEPDCECFRYTGPLLSVP